MKVDAAIRNPDTSAKTPIEMIAAKATWIQVRGSQPSGKE